MNDIEYRSIGGTVTQGEKPGINNLIINVNTSEISDWTDYVIIWNPRFNVSDGRGSPSTTILLRTQSSESPTNSATCLPLNVVNYSISSSASGLPRPTTSPLSPILAGLSFLIICFLKKSFQ
jgi:hypothetical protein